MANKKIKYTGEFDISQIVNGLKSVENQIKSMSSSTSLFAGVDKDFSKIEKLILDIKSQINSGFSDKKALNSFVKDIDTLYSSLNHIGVELKSITQSKSFELKDVGKANQEINSLERSIDSLQRRMAFNQKELATTLKGINLNDSSIQAITQQVKTSEQLESKLKDVVKQKQNDLKISEETARVQKEAAESAVRSSFSNMTGGKHIASKGNFKSKEGAAGFLNQIISAQMEGVLNNSQSIESAWDNIKKEMQQAGVSLNNNDAILNKITLSYNKMKKETQEIDNNLKNARQDADTLGIIDLNGEVQLSENAKDIINNFSFSEENLNQIEEFKKRIVELEEEIEKLKETADFTDINEQVEEYNSDISLSSEETNKYVEETRDAIQSQEKLNETFNNLKDNIKTILSITSVINGLKNVIRSTFNDVEELDKSFASIAMVTSYSVGQMWDNYDQYAEMANKLGQSTKDVIASSALFYQQGLETNEVLELTTSTMKLATLAGSDFSTATSQMTAALRGFNMEMSEGERVTDVYSELAASAAADVYGIAYAMSKTASLAASSGMAFETTSAFLTQMINVV